MSLKSLKAAKETLPAGWIRRKFSSIVSEELRSLWDEMKVKHRTKKDHLEKKLKPRKEEAKFRGIPISDRELGEDIDEDAKVLSC